MDGLFTPNEQSAIDSLLKAGFSLQQLPPILANISVETDGTFDYGMKQYGGGPGRGMFQFEGSQLSDYNKFKGDQEDSMYLQSKFVQKNIFGAKGDRPHDLGWRARGLLSDSLSDESSVRSKAKVFSEQYEKPSTPHLKKRQDEADRYNKLLFLNMVDL